MATRKSGSSSSRGRTKQSSSRKNSKSRNASSNTRSKQNDTSPGRNPGGRNMNTGSNTDRDDEYVGRHSSGRNNQLRNSEYQDYDNQGNRSGQRSGSGKQSRNSSQGDWYEGGRNGERSYQSRNGRGYQEEMPQDEDEVFMDQPTRSRRGNYGGSYEEEYGKNLTRRSNGSRSSSREFDEDRNGNSRYVNNRNYHQGQFDQDDEEDDMDDTYTQRSYGRTVMDEDDDNPRSSRNNSSRTKERGRSSSYGNQRGSGNRGGYERTRNP